MTQKSRPVRIGIIGHYGNQNLGDEAITSATIYQIRQRIPECELIGFSLNPAATEDRHGIKTYPIRRPISKNTESADQTDDRRRVARSSGSLRQSLKRIPIVAPIMKWLRDSGLACWHGFQEFGFLAQGYGRVRGLNLLIIAGSNQIEDTFGGSFGYPFTLWKWTRLARLVGVPVVFVSVGASPMQSALSRFFCRGALRAAKYRSLRDESSKNIVESIGVSGENLVFPDLAFSLPQKPATPKQAGETALTVAINPMPYLDSRYWPESEMVADRYAEYVGKLARFCRWLLGHGHRVILFPTQLSTDGLVSRDIVAAMGAEAEKYSADRLQIREIKGFDDLFDTIREADIVVATRFHAVLFGHLACLPVLALSYQQKIDDLMAASGQTPYCLSIGDFSLEQLEETFGRISQDRGICRKRITEQVLLNQTRLAGQFEVLTRLAH